MGGSAPQRSWLAVNHVEYRYRRTSVPVLNGIDAVFRPGLTVLLGPNGAGKTTLLRAIATLTQPVAGTISFHTNGRQLVSTDRQFRSLVGFMPQDPSFIDGFTAQEHLVYCGWLSGYDIAASERYAVDWLGRVGLTTEAQRPTSQLSGGMKRRLALASSTIADPQILLLDEPSVGLDPAQRASFRETLLALKGNRIVLMATHQVDDLMGLVDSVAIISAGRLVFHDRFEQLLVHGGGAGELVYQVETAYMNVMNAT